MQFEDLKAWQKARDLTNGVYQICRMSPLKNDFGLRDQLQRAAVSAMTNLAEGFDRVAKVKNFNSGTSPALPPAR
ncbi:MAG: four helix bundle protein [Verrucomicrobiota bacterium]|jgi:four helix bundle protein